MVMTNELPEVGSRWTIDDFTSTVTAVKKKGRGYYVELSGTVPSETGEATLLWAGRERLKDFQKKAKAVE
jgi:hypothetical protein